MNDAHAAVALALGERVERLVADLRRAGTPVRVAALIDAMDALRHVDIGARPEVRIALQATLVKREQDLATFDVLFDAWFPRRAGPHGPPSSSVRDRLVDAVGRGDPAALADLAREAAETAMGSAIGDGRGLFQRTARELGVSSLAQDALRASRAAGRGSSPALATAAVDRFLAALRGELLARRRILDPDERDPQQPLVVRPEDLEIAGASALELRQLQEAIRPLARRLAARLHEQHRDRRGSLDIRKTIRRSMTSGGVPLDTAWRRRRRHRPDLWLLCDVSGSVAEFARFTVGLVAAAHDEIPRCRTFLFVDDFVEVTSALAHRKHDVDAFALVGSAAVHLAGRRSHWGHALRGFEAAHGGDLGLRSTVVLTGDGRSHGDDSGADVVERLRRTARSVSILVPEQRERWGRGDSALPAYAQAGAGLHEVRTVAQLAAAIAEVVA